MAGRASQKATTNSQRKARPTTPDELPVAQPESRDELQVTMSNPNVRRRKRRLPDSDSEVQESISPTKVRSIRRTPLSQLTINLGQKDSNLSKSFTKASRFL